MISSQLPRDFVPDSTTHSEPDIIHGPSRTPSVYAPAAHAARDLGGQLVVWHGAVASKHSVACKCSVEV